ncbi:MAG: hypothetical protein JNL88_04390 [Bacteroidia bacterium]|nr:hypothetical protein [Bacteroidia bacterium]
MNRTFYPNSLDRTAYVITTMVILLALSLLVLSVPGIINADETARAGLRSGGILLLLLAAVFYLFHPSGYLVEGQDILVKRPAGLKRIPGIDIKTVRVPEKQEITRPIRILGNGGLFGYTGRYYTSSLGKMIWYCSRRSGYILIERKESIPVMISPDRGEEFVKEYYA